MPGVSDYITEIQKYAPYFDPTQGNVMNELNRRSSEGATTDQVVNDALGPGGYAENQLSAQSYLKPQYDAQLAGLDTQQKQAQSTADYGTGIANNAADRLMQAVARTYQQRQANNPLARQGIVSGAAQNYQTDEEARNYANINTDLQTQLHDIAGQLGATTGGIAAEKSALMAQQPIDVRNLVSGARQNLQLSRALPVGQIQQGANGTNVVGQNPSSITDLFANPGFLRLLSSSQGNSSLMPALNAILNRYGINVY